MNPTLVCLVGIAASLCVDEMDCGANGVCLKNGRCQCDRPWRGPQCSNLALLPVDRNVSGYHLPTSSSWGGSILRENFTVARHWMWSSEFVGECGLKSWTRNSRVVLTVSDNGPAGPYHFVKELWPVFSHEPAAVRAPTGEFVVYFTSDAYGTGTKYPCVPPCFGGPGVHPGGKTCLGVCANGSTFVAGDKGKPICADNKTIEHSPLVRLPTVMSWAPHPLGPWSTPVVVYNGSDGSAWDGSSGDTNFAGVILNDSSVVGLWRGVGAPNSAPVTTSNPRGQAQMQYLARASHWRDEASYNFGRAEASRNVFPIIASENGQNCGVEDPTVWLDAKGRLHTLVHNYRAGGHAASDDSGRSWRWYGGRCGNHSDPGWCEEANCSAWGTPVHFTDGSQVELQQRERPHVVLGVDGHTVVALSTGVREPDGLHDRTWTMVQLADHDHDC
jgi:hypothetical protein